MSEVVAAGMKLTVHRPDVLRRQPEVTVDHLARVAQELNTRIVDQYGGLRGIVDDGLLRGALGAAFQKVFGQEAYTNDWQKAGAMMRGVIGDHVFKDGNKRTGWMLAAFYLEQTGHTLPDNFSVDQAEEVCLAVAEGRVKDPIEIGRRLQRIWLKPE